MFLDQTYYIRLPEGGAEESDFLTNPAGMQMHHKIGKLRNGEKDRKTDCHSVARALSDAADILRALTWLPPGTASPPDHLLTHAHQHVHMGLLGGGTGEFQILGLSAGGQQPSEKPASEGNLASRPHSPPSRDSAHLLEVTSSAQWGVSFLRHLTAYPSH